MYNTLVVDNFVKYSRILLIQFYSTSCFRRKRHLRYLIYSFYRYHPQIRFGQYGTPPICVVTSEYWFYWRAVLDVFIPPSTPPFLFLLRRMIGSVVFWGGKHFFYDFLSLCWHTTENWTFVAIPRRLFVFQSTQILCQWMIDPSDASATDTTTCSCCSKYKLHMVVATPAPLIRSANMRDNFFLQQSHDVG